MKNTILFAALLMISASAFSQDTSMHKMHNGNMHNKTMMHNMKDCIMMKDGAPMVMKGGETMPMSEQMTLPNGTVVMTDGNVKMKNGATKMMKNGDCIYMDGTMSKMPMPNNMKMKKDSTMM